METERMEVKKELDWKLIALILLAVIAVLYPLLSAVPRVERTIDSIGAVTLQSEEAILQAEQAYAALKPEQQMKVDNHQVLVAARLEYECLVVEDAIERIGSINLDAEEAIRNAEMLYDALSNAQRQTVDNRAELKAARRDYEHMVSLVQEAKDAIDAIGAVTLDSGDRVKAARAVYDALAELEKTSGAQLLTALEDRGAVLTAAEDTYLECVVEFQYEEALTLFHSQQYSQALEAFRALVEQYPDSAKGPQAEEQSFRCLLKLSEEAHNRGDQYTAMAYLKEVDGSFTSDEAYKGLMDRILTRLTGSRPANGAKMSDKITWGWCELRVTASDRDVCVRVVSGSNKDKVTMFYVRSGETASVKLENGTYNVIYTTGDYWFETTHGFGEDAKYGKITGKLTLNSWIEGNMVYYYRYDLDFANPFNSDFSTATASASDFWG